MISVRRANERGHANFGWLNSHHTFSFGEYFDKEHMGFSALRVINDDTVSPGAGFGTHGHSDMEIISYVLSGEIAHKDSEGNVETLPPGEFQLMSAGSGIRHSEFNPSTSDPLHFLQIWIEPNVKGLAPDYQQKNFGSKEGLTLIASPDGTEQSLVVKQDARLYQLVLEKQSGTLLKSKPQRSYFVHLVAGKLSVLGETLNPGDGVKITSVDQIDFNAAQEHTKALVFDLP